MPRTGSGGRGCILNADIRPYRWCTAAAASDDNGHGVVHGGSYKAATGRRQDMGRALEANPVAYWIPMRRNRAPQMLCPAVSPANRALASELPPLAALPYHSTAFCISLGTPTPLS